MLSVKFKEDRMKDKRKLAVKKWDILNLENIGKTIINHHILNIMDKSAIEGVVQEYLDMAELNIDFNLILREWEDYMCIGRLNELFQILFDKLIRMKVLYLSCVEYLSRRRLS